MTVSTAPGIAPEIRYLDGEHCMGWFGNVLIILSRAQPSLEFMRQGAKETEALGQRAGVKPGVLVVIRSDADPPDDEARNYIKREFVQHPIAALAHVVEGTGFRGSAVRSVLTMIYFTIRPAFPLKIFGELADGASWLSAELGGMTGQAPDARELLRAVAELRTRFKDSERP
jgi:hypothetical protein